MRQIGLVALALSSLLNRLWAPQLPGSSAVRHHAFGLFIPVARHPGFRKPGELRIDGILLLPKA